MVGMMSTGTIKKWGNSFGVLLSKKEVERIGLKENDEVEINFHKKTNPLLELWGSNKNNSLTRKEFNEWREKHAESKWFD